MRFDSKTLRLVLLGGLVGMVVAFFVVLFLGLSFLSSQSRKMVGLKVQSQTDETLLSNLEETKKQVEKYDYFKTAAQDVIPNDKDQAAAVLEINQLAANAGIAIQSITFPASNLGLSVSALGTSSPAASAGASAPAISQAVPVAGIPGLYSLQLTITPQTGSGLPPNLQITYPKMLSFIEGIENNRRTAQITAVSVQPDSQSQGFNFSLTINIFIKP